MAEAVEPGFPDTSEQPLLGAKNLGNLLLLLAVPLPSVVATAWLFHHFEPGEIPADPGWARVDTLDATAAFLLHHPLVTINLLFFVNVCLVFWWIALIQRSTWLIDPYWSLLPPLIAAFLWTHPLAEGRAGPRAVCTLTLLGVWAVRLTHSYFRRERWRFGLREDWRFAKKRAESKQFWWVQFFYVYGVQQVMLVGLCLPLWAIAFSDAPATMLDGVLATLAAFGLVIAHVADTELARFMAANADRRARGQPVVPVLDAGVWRYSRHPNYFGEQVFWWSIAGLGVVAGTWWVVAGTLFNSVILAAVTVMTERRVLAKPERSEAYAAYIERTSAVVPWLPRAA